MCLSILIIVLFYVFFLCNALLVLGALVYSSREYLDARTWEKADVTRLNRSNTISYSEEGYSITCELNYTFVFKGREYNGDRVSIWQTNLEVFRCDELERQYRDGELVVFYDRTNPARCLLDRSMSLYMYNGMVIFTYGAVVVCLPEAVATDLVKGLFAGFFGCAIIWGIVQSAFYDDFTGVGHLVSLIVSFAIGIVFFSTSGHFLYHGGQRNSNRPEESPEASTESTTLLLD